MVALFTVVLLGACSGDDTYLPALLADPMAEYVPPGTRLVAMVTEEKGVGLQGKPTHAQVVRTFEAETGEDIISRLDVAVEYATSVGWAVVQATTSENLYRGEKALAPGDGELWIGLHRSDPIFEPDSPPNQLSVTLEYARRNSG